MLPSTFERVPHNTADEINQQIHRQTEANVARCASEGGAVIAQRLEELVQECVAYVFNVPFNSTRHVT